MSDDKQQAKSPSHLAYQVSEGQDGKSYFNKVGAAWKHKDGQGYNLHLDSMPVDGRVTLRTPKERLDEMRGGGKPDGQEHEKRAPQDDKAQER